MFNSAFYRRDIISSQSRIVNLIEQMADLLHHRWRVQQNEVGKKYKRDEFIGFGELLPKRDERLNSMYMDLSEEDKNYYREEARKFLSLFSDFLQENTADLSDILKYESREPDQREEITQMNEQTKIFKEKLGEWYNFIWNDEVTECHLREWLWEHRGNTWNTLLRLPELLNELNISYSQLMLSYYKTLYYSGSLTIFIFTDDKTKQKEIEYWLKKQIGEKEIKYIKIEMVSKLPPPKTTVIQYID